MIARGLVWLAGHRRVAIVLALAYGLATILPHEVVNGGVLRLQQALGRVRFVALVGALGLAALIGMVTLIVRGCRRPAVRRSLLVWSLLVAAALTASQVLLISVVSEGVHFVQYALLVLLLLPVIGRVGTTMIWATLVGVLDEGYQFWVLHRDWGIYLDFNDILLNAVGAALGGVLAAAALGLGVARAAPRWRRAGSFALAVAMGALALGGVLAATGRIARTPGPAAAGAWLLLDRGAPPPAFWTFAEWAQKRYHVLGAGEGALLLALAALLFAFADAWFEPWAPTVGEARQGAGP